MKLDDKATISKDTINRIGGVVEGMIDEAERSYYRALGAKEAMSKHVDNLLKIAGATDDELNKTIPDIDTLKLVKGWLLKTVHATQNFADHLSNVMLSSSGEMAGHKKTHDFLQKMTTQVDSKVAQIQQAIEAGDIEIDEDGNLSSSPGKPRPIGVRPGKTIKQQRIEEQQAGGDGGNGVDMDSMSVEELEAYLLSQ